MRKIVQSLIVPNLALLLASAAVAGDQWVVYPGGEGPGRGKNVVLVSGDEEYRSEEALPQLAKILANRHGFTCTVLFAIGKDGSIDPNRRDNIPGLEALRKADLMIIATRFRELPDEQMKEIVDYVESGRPIIGMRTATHAFSIKPKTKYSHYSYNSKEWDGGFGRQVLGETWINHHGHHAHESTRGIIAPGQTGHPILRGIKDGDIWGPTDVYGVRLPLPGDSKALVLGQVVADMTPSGKPVASKKNDPMMPIAWVKTYTGATGTPARIFTTTMGAATDLESPGVRRLLVNAAYWAVGLEQEIPAESDVRLIGEYKPRPFGFGGAAKGIKPEAHAAYGGETNGLPRQAVSGQVTFRGQPLEVGSIAFRAIEGSVSAEGRIEHGSYSISRDKGLVPGKYKVVIVGREAAEPKCDPGAAPGSEPRPKQRPAELIPPKYNTHTTFTVEITAGLQNVLDFDLR